jgi:hypothetical protein
MSRRRPEGRPSRGRDASGSRPPGPRDAADSAAPEGSSPDSADPASLARALGGKARPAPTTVVRGTLRRVEVEPQPLVLDADDGTTWELLFPAGWSVDAEPGARVTVAGDPAADVTGDVTGHVAADVTADVTASMVGPALRVRSLSRGD